MSRVCDRSFTPPITVFQGHKVNRHHVTESNRSDVEIVDRHTNERMDRHKDLYPWLEPDETFHG